MPVSFILSGLPGQRLHTIASTPTEHTTASAISNHLQSQTASQTKYIFNAQSQESR